MKKLSMFQITLLAVFGALAVAGVLIFALAVGGGNAKTVGPVTIWGTLDSGAFTTVLRQVADVDASMNQVSYVQKDTSTFQSELTEALASGQGPDIFVMTDSYAVKDAEKVVSIPFKSFSETQFKNTFAEAAESFIGSDGILALPFAADPLVLYWNRDMLSSAGFSQPPGYWDQLFTMAQKLTVRDDSGSILKSALAFGEYQNVANAKDILAALILQAGGTITGKDSVGNLQSALVSKTGGISSQATVSALRFFTEFADPSKDDYSWNRSLPDARTSFTSGDLALYVGFVSEEAKIARMNPNLNFAIAPLPQIRNAERALNVARVYAFAAPKSGKNPSSAILVASVLSSSDNAQALSSALALPPVRRDLLEKSAGGDVDLFNKMTIISHSWLDPDPVATAGIFRAMIEDTTSGAALINEAVSRADQQLGHLLSQQRE